MNTNSTKSYSVSTGLIRKISSRADIASAIEAHELFQANRLNQTAASYFFESMVLAYGRPFFKSNGIGKLQDDYPNFADFEDKELNLRHKRFIDLRNKFVAHSSIEGTRVQVVPPAVINPITGELRNTYDHNIGKRKFYSNSEYAMWIIKVAYELKKRLENDIHQMMCIELEDAPRDIPFEIETGYESFVWSE
jgi:hypothetical protein